MLNMNKCKIIAEIGWNHMGSIDLAKKMIDAAVFAGVDICKFQTWKVKNLKKGPWNDDGRIDIYKKAELSNHQYEYLVEYCKKKGVSFLTSVFNLSDIDLLLKLNLKSIKIPSHEVYNKELIKKCNDNFDEIYVSIGACTWKEIEEILKQDINFKKINFMHCVSSYPLEHENVNLPKLLKLKNIFGSVGYSGHLPGIDDAIAAISLGANVVEKHFTIDQNLPGRDNKFAVLPEQMKKICDYNLSFNKMILDKGLGVQECEQDIYKNYRGRWSKN